MEKLNPLLRRTFATATANEICFIYVPKERIDKPIFEARFGDAELQYDGVTYSFDEPKLHQCFDLQPPVSPALSTVRWTLSIPPCTERSIVTVVLATAKPHAMQDQIIAVYAPSRAAETVGKTAVHFFGEQSAAAFVRRYGLVE